MHFLFKTFRHCVLNTVFTACTVCSTQRTGCKEFRDVRHFSEKLVEVVAGGPAVVAGVVPDGDIHRARLLEHCPEVNRHFRVSARILQNIRCMHVPL